LEILYFGMNLGRKGGDVNKKSSGHDAEKNLTNSSLSNRMAPFLAAARKSPFFNFFTADRGNIL